MPNLVLNLLHLSDLHFGCDRTGLAHRQREQALDLLIDALPKEPYHALLISGDLTWQGKKEGYDELRTWLETKLFPRTGLSPSHCVFCPGNHDIDRKATKHWVKHTASAQEADELLDPSEPGFAPAFQNFIDFARDFGVPEPQPGYLSGIRELHGLRFVALNSAWFCRDSQTDKGNLWLGLPHLQSLLPHDTAKYDDEPLTIALVHHPDSWLNDADTNAYGIRPPAYRYLADRAHLILSGHTHGAVERCSRKYDRAREILAGAGYSTHDYRNNFSLLQIDPHQRTLVRRPWELDPRGPTWEAKPQQTYSLKLETITHQPHADPGRYLAWLRSETQFIALHQLNLSPTEVPPPAIDILYVRLKATPPARGEQLDRLEPAGLEEALKHPRLVIEGAPGGGKTTFLRWVAWTLVSGPPADWAVQDRCPLFLRLHEFDQYVASQPDPTKRSIPHFLGSRGWGLDDAYFEQRLQSADTVLLLDGLDEAATVQRRIDLVKLITQAAAHYPCRIVVTSRPGAHEGRATLQNFALARIEDLDPAGVEGFLRQWCQWLKKTAPEADAYYQELAPAVTIAGIRHLARNPLMLTALAVLHFRRHRLPDQRAKLYEQILDWLAEQATDRHPEYTKDQRLETFGQLALAMQSAPGGQILTIGIDDAAQLLPPPFAERVKFLEQAHVDSGIVTLRGKELVFWHRSFQEYLAARILLGFADQELHPRALGLLYSPEGREVLPLLAARLAESGKGRLEALLQVLIADALAQTELERKAHAVGVLGAMLTDAAPSKYELKDQTAYAKLRQSVMCIFEKGQAAQIGVKTRAAAAEGLGRSDGSLFSGQ